MSSRQSCLVSCRFVLANGLCAAEYCWLKQRDTAPSLPAVVVLLSDCHVEAILSGGPVDCINEELTDGSG